MPSKSTELARTKDQSLDSKFKLAALSKMGDVVHTAEHGEPRVGFPNYEKNAAEHLVSCILTDAIFNQDVYAVQTIVTRIDGNLPKDVDLQNYQTLFGDAMNEVLAMEQHERLQITPDDTVMMALCKSVYDVATRNIYWDAIKKKKSKPTTDAKKERDIALRLVLERAGGRKTLEAVQSEQSVLGVADWVSGALPSGN